MSNSKRIMLIDDETMMLMMIRDMLEELFPGVQIDCFSSGSAALKELETIQYDCVITDVVVPDVRERTLPDLILEAVTCPVIVASNLSDWGSQRMGDFAARIQKPFQQEPLGDVVGKVMSLKPKMP
jgi:FixJ family two-component response regulator